MQCLYVAGTTFYLPLSRGIHLWEVKNAVFVCGWDLVQVSASVREVSVNGRSTVCLMNTSVNVYSKIKHVFSVKFTEKMRAVYQLLIL